MQVEARLYASRLAITFTPAFMDISGLAYQKRSSAIALAQRLLPALQWLRFAYGSVSAEFTRIHATLVLTAATHCLQPFSSCTTI